MEYTAGALENPRILRKVLDVLEGTRRALNNPAQKYQGELTWAQIKDSGGFAPIRTLLKHYLFFLTIRSGWIIMRR